MFKQGKDVCGACGLSGAVSVAIWCDPATGEPLTEVCIGECHGIIGAEVQTNGGHVTHCGECDTYNVPVMTRNEYRKSVLEHKAELYIEDNMEVLV